MAMYLCANCDNFVDDDYHPCVPYGNTDLICPSCAEALGLDYDGNPIDDEPDVPEYQEWRDFDPDC